MSYALFIFLSVLLIQLAFSDGTGCKYKTDASQTASNCADTDTGTYLTSSNVNENKQKCFSLTKSDVESNFCCYDSSQSKCVTRTSRETSDPIYCPSLSDPKLRNNCGMAKFYQPVSKEACTEISLVNGYCCFVKTKNYGKACLKQDEIDEDEKDEITDYMKDYFRNRLGLNPDEEIASVQCEGSLLKYYGFLMILLSVICL